VPFAVTVDFEALENASVTVRERDSTSQVRRGAGRSAARRCPRAPEPLASSDPTRLPTAPSPHPHHTPHPVPQIRVPVAEIASIIRSLVDGATTWPEVAARFPAVAKAAAEEA
jgi:hypothetical protein